MSRIWLVRHGPTHAKTMVGWTDLPADLSDLDTLARLRAALPDAPMVSSDLIRAVATADAICGARPRLPHDPALREMHFGRWENKTWAQVEADDPHRARTFWEHPGDNAPPDGESWDALGARVCGALDALAASPDVIVVAHFGVILRALQVAGGWSARHALSHRIEPLSLSQLCWGAGRSVGFVNRAFTKVAP